MHSYKICKAKILEIQEEMYITKIVVEKFNTPFSEIN